MQDFDIKLAPGDVRTINIQADYIYYRAGSAGGADAAIEFSPLSGGETVFLYPGQSYRIPARSAGLGAAWAMKNRKGEATIIGSVLIGEGAFQDNRISGSVEVIDGARNRTMANQAFMATTYVNAGAGLYPSVMLWNPPDSGKRLLVSKVSRFSANTGNLGVVIRNARSATVDKNAQSKLSGGAVSTAQLCYEAKASITGTSLASDPATAQQEKVREFKEPVVILPGYGLELWNGQPQNDIQGSFEFIEELI